jgi:hypothetical protein
MHEGRQLNWSAQVAIVYIEYLLKEVKYCTISCAFSWPVLIDRSIDPI